MRTLILFAAAGVLLFSPMQPTPPLVGGEQFRVTFDHTLRWYQEAVPQTTPPTMVACTLSPPSAPCTPDTVSVDLLAGTAVLQSLPFTGSPVTFVVTGGLPAGTHSITVRAVGSGGTSTSAPVTLVVNPAQIVAPGPQGAPTISQTPPVTTLAGLTGQYYSTSAFGTLLLTRVDTMVNFDWVLGSPNAAVPIDNFSVRWTGFVTAPVSGSYTFSTTSDDGARLWINNVQIINSWIDQAPTIHTSAPVTLTAGVAVAVRLEYYERDGGAVARLQWTPPGGTLVAIPAGALTH